MGDAGVVGVGAGIWWGSNQSPYLLVWEIIIWLHDTSGGRLYRRFSLPDREEVTSNQEVKMSTKSKVFAIASTRSWLGWAHVLLSCEHVFS